MVKFNVIYDDCYYDVDIIAVPDEIANELSNLAYEFCCWTPPDDDPYGWTILNGKKVRAVETVGFVKWLNDNSCTELKEKANIVEQHIKYCDKYQKITVF